MPVVAGEPTSPLARVAAVADFGNGVSGYDYPFKLCRGCVARISVISTDFTKAQPYSLYLLQQ